MNIVLIGSGNVATQLGIALVNVGHTILQVYSRDINNAQTLANKLSSIAIDSFKQLDLKADIYIVSVKDDVLASLVSELPKIEGIVCHTAGSIEIDVLNAFNKHGVLYPFQTFTKDKLVNFSQVPFLLEANDEGSYVVLKKMAKSISDVVMEANSVQRGQLHISAVFACNFVNHMYRLSSDLLENSGLPFELLHPLIKETAEKVVSLSPRLTQTGPASRNDQMIIDKHLCMLKSNEPFESIYKTLTNSIISID